MTFLSSLSRMERAALFLLCTTASQTRTAEAFSTGKPLSILSPTLGQDRTSIPGRAPVDVFYVDDESSEEHTVLATAAQSPLFLGEDDNDDQPVQFPELVQELLVNDQQQRLEATDSSALLQPLQQDSLTAATAELAQSIQSQPLLLQVDNAEPTLSEQDIPALPSFRDYRKFALPCFGLLLSGPLLSLVDTAFVGLASTNSMELAALGPATTLFDCLTWLLSFLNVATTNLYSSALAKGSQKEAEGVVRTGSRVGLTIGVGVMATLMIFCQPILTGYMGTLFMFVCLLEWLVDLHSLC